MGVGGGPGDDRIDELIRELSETNRNLNRLIDAITRGAEREEEEREQLAQEDRVDLWDVGSSTPNVETVEEYITERRLAANSPNDTAPVTRGVDDFQDFYYQVYTRFGEHLEKISRAVDTDPFVRRLVTRYGVEGELINILETQVEDGKSNPQPPNAGFFGVVWEERELSIDYANTVLNFVKIQGLHYYQIPLIPTGRPEGEEMRDELASNPVSQLGLDVPGGFEAIENNIVEAGTSRQVEIDDIGFFIIVGGQQPREVNNQLAQIIDRRDGLELTQELRERFL